MEYIDQTVVTPEILKSTLGEDVDVDHKEAIKEAAIDALITGAAAYVYSKSNTESVSAEQNIYENAHALEKITESNASENVYTGVKQAAQYLKDQGVPRLYRKKVLESFDIDTVKLEIAGKDTYGLRFYGGNAEPRGRYLFETFSPLTNRKNLALPFEWNSMTDVIQFQVREGTTMIVGKAASQTVYGSQYVGGAHQWYINCLEDLIKCQ